VAVLGGILTAAVAERLAGPAAAQTVNQRQGQPAPTRPQYKALQPRQPAPEVEPARPPAPPYVGFARADEQTSRESGERDGQTAIERQLAETKATLGSHGLALTYATIGLMVVAASLWLMTFLQTRDLKAAVRAVQESSAAARNSADMAQRALVLTQRATVIVGEPKAIWLRDAGDALVGCRLLVTWRNVGNTPTRDMVAAVAGQALERPPAQNGAPPRADARQQPAIVGPNAEINSAYVNLPIGLVADILEHQAYYLFAGWAEYNDVFENTPRHRVEFCYWLEFDGDLDAQRLEARFHIHGKHNRHCDAVSPPESDAVAEPSKVKYGVSPSDAVPGSAGLTA
jgi:hypothetical protein